mmetsp:Transcript_10779/g.25307  ORF Transcript_10779/g.25307 Transcript_10779/m.25307 type:complete len:694 (-) Transcript_10779:79-2160(-)
MNRLKVFAEDAGRVAGHMQVEEFPDDMRRWINPAADPCDNFFTFACGHWSETEGKEIADDASSNALQWDIMDKQIEDAMKVLLLEGEGPAADLYRSCMKEATPADSAKVIEPWLDLVDTVVDNVTFASAVAAINNADMNMLFNWYVDVDSWNQTRYAFFFRPVSSTISEAVLTDGQSKWAKKHLGYFHDFIVALATLSGYDDDTAAEDARNVISVETQLAFNQNGTESGYDQWVDRDYLQIEIPSFDWDVWFDAIGFGTVGLEPDPNATDVDDYGQPFDTPRLIMSQGDYPSTIEDIISCKGVGGEQLDNETCWGRIRSYMRFKLLHYYATYMDSDYVDAVHDWTSKRFDIKTDKKRWLKCYDDTTQLLGWAASYLWIENTFPKERKQATRDMLDAIRDEFRDSLARTRWMDAGSRMAGQEKLDAMFFEVAYPDPWPESVFRNEGQLNSDGPYATNVDIVGANAVARARVRINESPQRSRWGESYPIVVNAFYSPSVNGLWVPAGIIQKPFYSENYTAARNYGALGTICGHEMTHGFDDTGHLRDKTGKEADWWDPKTFEEFDARANCLSDEYSRFGKEDARFDGKHVDGDYTLGENIADEGGMKFAYSAFRRTLPHQGRLSMAEDRLFFTAFAQNWCEVNRKKAIFDSLENDEHSPGKYRVLGVLTNFPPFAKAFNCPIGTKMNPPKQCELW